MDDKTWKSGKQTIQENESSRVKKRCSDTKKIPEHGLECLHEIEEKTYDLQALLYGFCFVNCIAGYFRKGGIFRYLLCTAALPNNRDISSGHYNRNLLVDSVDKPRVLRVDGKDSGSDTASSSDSETHTDDCNEKTGLLKETKSEKKKQLPRERSEILSLKDIKVGDHISFKRKAGYKHHAVVSYVSVKTGRFSIIEVIGNSNPLNILKVSSSKCLSAGVSERSMEFVNGDKMFKYTYEDNREDNINPVRVARILLHHGLPQDYHLRKFNCEHFATYCCTAYPYSQQTGTYNKRAKEMLDEIVMTEHSASSIIS